MYDYFYGAQADQFSFYRVPKVLFTNDRFREVSSEAKILYSILLERMDLSAKNGWIDEQGRVYIIYTLEEIMAFLSDPANAHQDTVTLSFDEGGYIKDYARIIGENTTVSEEEIFVAGEVILPINQTLMGLPGASIEEIRVVCSHAQGLAQSEAWRKEHMPDAAAREMASTAAAASYVSESGDKTIAAVAAPGAAKLYGLAVLAENVQITSANKTRFYVLAGSELKGKGLTNAVFTASCEANRIDDIITAIHNAGAELVTIHDRPEGSQLGMYNYIIEIQDPKGISDKLITSLEDFPELHYLGRFNVKIKENAKQP